MEIKAKLEQLHDVVERGNFRSRKVWVTTEDNPQFPQTIEIELQQNKVDIMNGISIGAPVVLHLNLRGRKWTSPENKTSVFNTLVCWKVVADGSVQPSSNIVEGQQAPDLVDESGEKLPF